MRKSMAAGKAQGAYQLEYVTDPDRADVMEPVKPINYNLAYKDPLKFMDNILETSNKQTTLTNRKSNFVSKDEKKALVQEEK